MISTLSAFTFNPDSPLIYGLYGAVVAFVVAMSLYYIVRSVRRAKELKMDMGKIKKVISTSVTFSILPAIGIGIGVVTLIGAIGIALPAIRLSVIGSLQYESMMADGAASAIIDGTLSDFINSNITYQDFVTIATVMTIPIVTGPLVVILFYKKFQPKVQMLSAKTGGGGVPGSGINIGDMLFKVVFIGMILGYLAMSITSIASGTGYLDNYYNFIAIIIAAVCMYIFDLLIEKAGQKWLDSFSTPLSMLIAMAVVAVISYFSYENGWPLKPDPDEVAAAANIIAAVM